MKISSYRSAALLSFSLLVGCASVAVTSDSIEQKTAFALGIEKGTFTVSDRVDDGLQTNYTVKTNDGRRFNCYVTGGVTYTGRTVSDAICNEVVSKQVGSASKTTPATEPATKKATSNKCNALLKAAGKC